MPAKANFVVFAVANDYILILKDLPDFHTYFMIIYPVLAPHKYWESEYNFCVPCNNLMGFNIFWVLTSQMIRLYTNFMTLLRNFSLSKYEKFTCSIASDSVRHQGRLTPQDTWFRPFIVLAYDLIEISLSQIHLD